MSAMTIDWWGLGLQAVNVLILVWLLVRVFWRPVAGAIARRQEAAQAMLDDGKAAQAKADAALAEVTEARAGIAAERDAMLAEARATADTATKAALTEAQTRADALMAAARTAIDRDRDTRAQGERSEGRRTIGRDRRQAPRPVQHSRGSGGVPCPAGRGHRGHVRVRPRRTGRHRSRTSRSSPRQTRRPRERAKIERAVIEALGGAPTLRFVTDPDLIAGLELRSAHFVLHNSWRADLEEILKEVKHAA